MADAKKPAVPAPDLTMPTNTLAEHAASITQALWDRGVIIADPKEPLLPDGMHKFIINPQHKDDCWLGAALQPVMPDLLVMLHGAIPKGVSTSK